MHLHIVAHPMAVKQAKFPKGWHIEDEGRRVGTEVETRDFRHAVELVRRIAEVAERLDHHPDVHIESWNHLRIVSSSHDVGKLTERDEKLVTEVDAILAVEGLQRH